MRKLALFNDFLQYVKSIGDEADVLDSFFLKMPPYTEKIPLNLEITYSTHRGNDIFSVILWGG